MNTWVDFTSGSLQKFDTLSLSLLRAETEQPWTGFLGWSSNGQVLHAARTQHLDRLLSAEKAIRKSFSAQDIASISSEAGNRIPVFKEPGHVVSPVFSFSADVKSFILVHIIEDDGTIAHAMSESTGISSENFQMIHANGKVFAMYISLWKESTFLLHVHPEPDTYVRDRVELVTPIFGKMQLRFATDPQREGYRETVYDPTGKIGVINPKSLHTGLAIDETAILLNMPVALNWKDIRYENSHPI